MQHNVYNSSNVEEKKTTVFVEDVIVHLQLLKIKSTCIPRITTVQFKPSLSKVRSKIILTDDADGTSVNVISGKGPIVLRDGVPNVRQCLGWVVFQHFYQVLHYNASLTVSKDVDNCNISKSIWLCQFKPVFCNLYFAWFVKKNFF